MRTLLTSCLLIAACCNSFSQKVIDVENENASMATSQLLTRAGTPFLDAKFVSITGSPFFNEKMMRGIILLADGTQYKNLNMRLNLIDLQVNFLDHKQKELVVGVPVREVTLVDTSNSTIHNFIFSDYIETTYKPEKDFYELLQTGKAQLFKQYKKTIKETRKFNSATFDQSIETYMKYFVLIDGHWKKVTKIKNLPTVLSDKKAEIEQFINSKNLSGDNQEAIELVISYYNSFFSNQ